MDLFLADKPRFAIEAAPSSGNLYLTQVWTFFLKLKPISEQSLTVFSGFQRTRRAATSLINVPVFFLHSQSFTTTMSLF